MYLLLKLGTPNKNRNNLNPFLPSTLFYGRYVIYKKENFSKNFFKRINFFQFTCINKHSTRHSQFRKIGF